MFATLLRIPFTCLLVSLAVFSDQVFIRAAWVVFCYYAFTSLSPIASFGQKYLPAFALLSTVLHAALFFVTPPSVLDIFTQAVSWSETVYLLVEQFVLVRFILLAGQFVFTRFLAISDDQRWQVGFIKLAVVSISFICYLLAVGLLWFPCLFHSSAACHKSEAEPLISVGVPAFGTVLIVGLTLFKLSNLSKHLISDSAAVSLFVAACFHSAIHGRCWVHWTLCVLSLSLWILALFFCPSDEDSTGSGPGSLIHTDSIEFCLIVLVLVHYSAYLRVFLRDTLMPDASASTNSNPNPILVDPSVSSFPLPIRAIEGTLGALFFCYIVGAEARQDDHED